MADHEWYVLDEFLRRSTVIEGFKSFIWTERYNTAGDFQIVTKPTYVNRTLLSEGTFITRKDSTYVGLIDTVVDGVDDSGEHNLTITGQFLEALLNDRVAMPSVTDTTTQPNWVITGTPGDIIRFIFNEICVVCVLDTHDTIPFYTIGTLLPAGSIPEPADVVTITAAPDTVYNTITQIAASYSIGFRLVRNGDQGEIYFEVYMGNDHTSEQTERPAVIFDPAMDTLIDQTTFTSAAGVKTVAYIFASNGSAIVDAPFADASAYDVGRRVLLINSSNSDDAGPDLTTALTQEALMALAQQGHIYNVDGTLPQSFPYTYGADYNLGDLVEERNDDGVASQMLVTEVIFSSDASGDTVYPTLTLSQTVVSGSWLSFADDLTWDSMDQTVDWHDI